MYQHLLIKEFDTTPKFEHIWEFKKKKFVTFILFYSLKKKKQVVKNVSTNGVTKGGLGCDSTENFKKL